jgi:hypothetical protein
VPSPTTTALATTTAPPVVTPEVVGNGCALTSFHGPSITYTSGGRLYELSADGRQATCLTELTSDETGRLSWSPSGARVLLGPAYVLDDAGTRVSGYFATNPGVQWSYPTGKALIAPSVSQGTLIWRSSADSSNRLDISFLVDTDIAVYHPAGKNILAVGVDGNGTHGLFVASNRGANPRALATLDDPATTITDVAVDVHGDHLFIVHDHGTYQEIHRLDLPSLTLTDVIDSPSPLAELTLGPTRDSPLAFRQGDCATTTRALVSVAGGSIDPAASMPALADRSTTPVGWLDGHRLVIAARSTGCTGPADVWSVDLDGSAQLMVSGVDEVAVRSMVQDIGELPGDINSQAPG